jgi:hypothetical protein
MIEKYFQPGIRLTWMKPNDGPPSLDGKIIDSRGAASQMLYDGLDGELINPTFMTTNITTLGFTKNMPIAYDWLDYAPGSTAKKALGGKDILTGYMSGCIIAKWKTLAQTYLGHIGTIDSMPDVTKKVKGNFGAVMGRDTKGFDPFASWPTVEIDQVRSKFKAKPLASIIALVTSSGKVYSILMLSIPKQVDNFDPTKVVAIKQDNWCVGGIKEVLPMSDSALKMKMR